MAFKQKHTLRSRNKSLSLFVWATTGLLANHVGAVPHRRLVTLCEFDTSICDGTYATTVLDADTYGITGTIPSEIGLLTNLEFMALARNGLTGTIPTQIGLLTNLKEMSLHYNSLSGSVPTQIGKLTALQHIHLTSNSLTGAVPTQIALLTNLNSLSLDDSVFACPLPALPNKVLSDLQCDETLTQPKTLTQTKLDPILKPALLSKPAPPSPPPQAEISVSSIGLSSIPTPPPMPPMPPPFPPPMPPPSPPPPSPPPPSPYPPATACSCDQYRNGASNSDAYNCVKWEAGQKHCYPSQNTVSMPKWWNAWFSGFHNDMCDGGTDICAH